MKANEISDMRLSTGVPGGSLADRINGPTVINRSIDPSEPAPNFFIVGAAKAGTTSLHAYLSQHPGVFMPVLKEPHYFASFRRTSEFDNFLPVIRDPISYQALFAGSRGFKAVGEASPSYLCDTSAAAHIKSAIPEARIVISLRNPVQRAYSHYLMEYHEGRETRSFREALLADQSRTQKGWGVSFQYIELGLYSDQVERYFDAFGKERVLVLLFEDLVLDTGKTMRQLAEFLDIDPEAFPESVFMRVHNPYEASRGAIARAILRARRLRVWAKRWIPQSLRTAVRDRMLFSRSKKPPLESAFARELAELFATDLRRLEILLGRNLDVLREDA